MTLLLVLIVPLILGLIAFYVESVKTDLALLLAGAVFHSTMVVLLWMGLPAGDLAPLLALDEAGRLFLSVTSALFLAASLYSVPYVLGETHDEQSGAHRFVPFLLWFASAMTLVCVTQHLALLWAAVEATTLASAPLVLFYRRRAALEATWKYLLVCSVGIALALLGTFFLGIAAATPEAGTPPLVLPDLIAAAPTMERPWLKAAFVLALVGYGTKMGLAPMHTWLPDTHSQAPSPVSALLSGALLNTALLGILRFYQVCLASGDAEFARTLLLVLGLVTIGISTAFMVRQSDFKRLLAYSSIENMGIVAVGIGVGGAATYGAMLHAVNHSLCKAGLFFLAGNVLRRFGTTRIDEVRGVLQRLPVSGALMLALVLAIGGLPPFGPFLSELIVFQGATRMSPWLGALFAVLVAIAFLGMAGALLPALQGHSSSGRAGPPPREAFLSWITPAAMIVASLVLGTWLPPQISEALRRTSEMLGGD